MLAFSLVCIFSQVHLLLDLLLQVNMNCQLHCQSATADYTFGEDAADGIRDVCIVSSLCPSFKHIALLVIFRSLTAALFTLLFSMACCILVTGLENSPSDATEPQQLGWLQHRILWLQRVLARFISSKNAKRVCSLLCPIGTACLINLQVNNASISESGLGTFAVFWSEFSCLLIRLRSNLFFSNFRPRSCISISLTDRLRYSRLYKYWRALVLSCLSIHPHKDQFVIATVVRTSMVRTHSFSFPFLLLTCSDEPRIPRPVSQPDGSGVGCNPRYWMWHLRKHEVFSGKQCRQFSRFVCGICKVHWILCVHCVAWLH